MALFHLPAVLAAWLSLYFRPVNATRQVIDDSGEHAYAPITRAAPVLISSIGKTTVPPRWLELSEPLAASCSSLDCTDRYGFAEAREHALFPFFVCVAARQDRYRHVSIRTTTDASHSMSHHSILYVRQQNAGPVEEWNGHGLGECASGAAPVTVPGTPFTGADDPCPAQGDYYVSSSMVSFTLPPAAREGVEECFDVAVGSRDAAAELVRMGLEARINDVGQEVHAASELRVATAGHPAVWPPAWREVSPGSLNGADDAFEAPSGELEQPFHDWAFCLTMAKADTRSVSVTTTSDGKGESSSELFLTRTTFPGHPATAPPDVVGYGAPSWECVSLHRKREPMLAGGCPDGSRAVRVASLSFTLGPADDVEADLQRFAELLEEEDCFRAYALLDRSLRSIANIGLTVIVS